METGIRTTRRFVRAFRTKPGGGFVAASRVVRNSACSLWVNSRPTKTAVHPHLPTRSPGEPGGVLLELRDAGKLDVKRRADTDLAFIVNVALHLFGKLPRDMQAEA